METGPPSDWLTWELYDTDTCEVVARGEWQSQEQRLFGPPRLTVSPGGRWIVKGGRGDKELIVRDGLTNRITCKMVVPEGSAIGEILFDPADERLAVMTVPTGLAVSWVVGKHGFVSPAKPAAPRAIRPTTARPGDGGRPLDPAGRRRMLRSRAWHGKAPAHVSDAHEPGRAVPRWLLGRDQYLPCLGGADGNRGARTHT